MSDDIKVQARRAITPGSRAELYFSAASDGLTVAETSKKFNTTEGAVRQVAFQCGFRFASKKHPTTALMEYRAERYRECADSGMTAQQIADKFDVCKKTVLRAARRGAFLVPRPARPRPNRRDYEMEGRAAKMAADGISPKEISASLGFTLQATYKILKRIGIKPHHPKRSNEKAIGGGEA